MSLAGRIHAGRYDVVQLLGSGGMGEVYRAYDQELDEIVALKVIRPELAKDARIVERFRREVKLARRVTHPNVARVYELGFADGALFCTMELVGGESLRTRLDRAAPLPVAEAVSIARELCGALAAAHDAGVVHCDIKPDNILLDGDRIVLADFGIAAVALAEQRDIAGTPEYMAPEQADGDPPTPASDIYAVGIVLYEMLTGQRPFHGDDAAIRAQQRASAAVRIEADELAALSSVVERATAHDRTARIASADELAELLAPWTAPKSPHVRADAAGAPRSSLEPTQRSAWADLRTVIVLAPPMIEDEAAWYVIESTHEALFRKLARQSGVRVLPRRRMPDDTDATVVELVASEQLRIEIRMGGRATRLELPLDHASTHLAVDAVAAILNASLEQSPETTALEAALAMSLRLRFIGYRDSHDARTARAKLERVRATRPEDPRVAAALASVMLRGAMVDDSIELDRAASLVQFALEHAPDLVDSHVAAGHLELHAGEAALAARHFRRAIACAPNVAAGHEGMGRLLLEAGFVDLGRVRVEQAYDISQAGGMQWDIARLHALDGNWEEFDRHIAALPVFLQRTVIGFRYAVWRGDVATMQGYRVALAPSFGVGSMPDHVAQSLLDGRWVLPPEDLVARLSTDTTQSRRRKALFAQLLAEAAGKLDDPRTALAATWRAVEYGLFDRPWLERCPLLGHVRIASDYSELHAIVKRRADAILDALYGDAPEDQLVATVVL